MGGFGLAVSPTTNEMYAVVKLFPGSGFNRELVKLNPYTGIATIIGSMEQSIEGLVFDDAGVLYAISGVCTVGCDGAAMPETLFTVDLNDASLTPFQMLGNGDSGEAIAFNPNDGLMYHMSGTGAGLIFETVNLSNGTVTGIPLSGDPLYDRLTSGLVFDESRNLFLASLVDLQVFTFVTLTPEGALTDVGDLAGNWTDFAFFNASETDTDSDGVPDNWDAFPDDPTEWADTDGDDVGDNEDAFPYDPSETTDTDSDGVGDNADLDDDNDGLPDIWEQDNGLDSLDPSDAGEDPDGDGASNLQEYDQGSDPQSPDTDSDAVLDGVDNCPLTLNGDQLDADNDGVGDGCDADSGVAVADVTQVADISGDAAPDLVLLAETPPGKVPTVVYRSGANGAPIGSVPYLNAAWQAIGVATVADTDGDGVALDPSVAVLAHNPSTGKHVVQTRRADTGGLVSTLFFLNAAWDVIDVAVVDDTDGDGVPSDPSIAVLGVNLGTGRIVVQVRRLSDGSLIDNHFYLNPVWTPLALEGVDRRAGLIPLLSVLAENESTGKTVVQARLLSDGALQRNTYFLNTAWRGLDLAILEDSNGNGILNDPVYLVLATNPGTGKTAVQARRVGNGALEKTLFFLNSTWLGSRVLSTGDLSGNGFEEVAVLADNPMTDNVVIQLKDYATTDNTANVFP